MTNFPLEPIETASVDELQALQLTRMQWSLQNAYEQVPSFISTDVVLHVFHVRLDDEVALLEQQRALPALKAFASAQLARALAAWPATGAPSPPVRALALYHATALALLDPAASIDPRVAVGADRAAVRRRVRDHVRCPRDPTVVRAG